MAEIPIQADVLCTPVPRLRYSHGRHPDFNNPLVVVLPTVASPQQSAAGGSVTFPVSISEFIRGSVSVKDSAVLYIGNHLRTGTLSY
jgi:hypothetical protein